MTEVYLSLGSNINPKVQLKSALKVLKKQFNQIELSTVYESEAVGFVGDNFLNLVVLIKTKMPLSELITLTKSIEVDHGRIEKQKKFSDRSLDIDVLTYGDFIGHCCGLEIPRQEINENAFVLLPLSEIAADKCHPKLKKSYKELWQCYDQNKQRLWPIEW